MVKINGQMEEAEGKTIQMYLQEKHYDFSRLAVECNDKIVPKSEYASFVLKENDVLEVVSFVGGG